MYSENFALADELIVAAKARGVKLALAESCTGGMIAAAITAVPGSSEVFQGSAVTYSNEAKEDLLCVGKGIIIENGAVSGECAAAMAHGARRIYGADMALSVTGVAGPDGGTAEKPVGTVWFGYSAPGREETFHCLFPGGREEIRSAAVKTALRYLLEELS